MQEASPVPTIKHGKCQWLRACSTPNELLRNHKSCQFLPCKNFLFANIPVPFSLRLCLFLSMEAPWIFKAILHLIRICELTWASGKSYQKNVRGLCNRDSYITLSTHFSFNSLATSMLAWSLRLFEFALLDTRQHLSKQEKSSIKISHHSQSFHSLIGPRTCFLF